MSIATVYLGYINIIPKKGLSHMKNCLVISTSEETYSCPVSDSHEEVRLWLHIYCPLAELCLNHYGFSLPLRNRTEILTGEILSGMQWDGDIENMFVVRLRTVYSKNFLPNADDIERMNYINNRCTRHQHISSSQSTAHRMLCKYCREEADLLLVVSPADRMDPETAELLATAQQKQIPILHYDPETFETIRENLPGPWITYTDMITESDVEDFFSADK